MVPESVSVPDPLFVRLKFPEITPPSVKLFAVAVTDLFPFNVILPVPMLRSLDPTKDIFPLSMMLLLVL